jgi:hypothetical protein
MVMTRWSRDGEGAARAERGDWGVRPVSGVYASCGSDERAARRNAYGVAARKFDTREV